MNTSCLIFSKDRACQLLLLLESLKNSIQLEMDILPCTVLFKASSDNYRKQYVELMNLFPNINFQEELNLCDDTNSIINESSGDYITLVVDDCVFSQSFSIIKVEGCLNNNQNILGFSLRLGTNINYCYPFNTAQKMPTSTTMGDFILKYDWPSAKFDFGYPLEVSSSIYRKSDIIKIITDKKFHSVNQLEYILDVNKSMFSQSKPYLACFDTSRAFCNPLNIVSNPETNMNRKSHNQNYSSELLAKKFDDGFKIDVSKFKGFITNSCHYEFDLVWVKR